MWKWKTLTKKHSQAKDPMFYSNDVDDSDSDESESETSYKFPFTEFPSFDIPTTSVNKKWIIIDRKIIFDRNLQFAK